MNTQRRRAFTLIELLIVVAIIAILAALIFPSFSAAREDARQKSCTSNLREIGLAVQMYRIEEREYPMSLGVLLPPANTPSPAALPGATAYAPKLDNTNATLFVDDPANPNNACAPDNTCPNVGGTGYLRDTKYLLCPDDRSASIQPRSTYGDLSTGFTVASEDAPITAPEQLSRRTWNFWGLRDDGVAYTNSAKPASLYTIGNELLVDPSRKYVAPDTPPVGALPALADYRTNVVRNSLSNRFAPPSTIVTYCPYHRPYSSSVSSAEKLYDATDPGDKKGARDLILRVDGTVKSVVVSSWRSAGAIDATLPADPNYKMWQRQTFR